MPYPRSPGATWKPFQAPRLITHLVSGPLYGILVSDVPPLSYNSARERGKRQCGKGRAPDPDNLGPCGELDGSRGTCLPLATMSSLACQNPIKRCAVYWLAPTKLGAMMFFFSFLSSVTLADSEKNYRVSHFTTTNTTPGERQKLITLRLRHRKESFIDLQLAAVRRQRGQEGKQGKINIIRSS